MYQRNRGSSIVIVVLVILAAGVALYFISDPFQTRAKQAYKDLSEWTPENIAKDPVMYLNFCEEQTKETLQKLKASEISIAQKLAKLQDMKAKSDGKIQAGTKALGELKAAYLAAKESDTWPVTWRTKSLSEAETKKQIVTFHGQVESEKKIQSTAEKGINKLKIQEAKIDETRTACQEQLTQIDTNREMLEVQSITEDLTEQLVSMKGVLESSVIATISSDDEAGTLSLDDLTSDAAASVDDSAFDAIMAE